MVRKLQLGDIVNYVPRKLPQPRFMMWTAIESGLPVMDWSPFYWSPGDSGIVVDIYFSYVKVLKFGDGCGWIMKSCISSVCEKKKK